MPTINFEMGTMADFRCESSIVAESRGLKTNFFLDGAMDTPCQRKFSVRKDESFATVINILSVLDINLQKEQHIHILRLRISKVKAHFR